MSRPTWGLAGASLLLAVALMTGCSDPTATQETGPLQLTLQKTAVSGLQSAGPVLSVSSGEDAAGPIELSNILCLTVEITGVHLLPVVEDDPDTPEEEEAMWERLAVTPFTVDLANLPRVGDDPEEPLVVVFDPDVPVGEYRKVRFITADENEIFFETGFEVGQWSYDGNDDGNCTNGHSVTVPSGSQSGLKIDMEFTVESADGNPTSIDLLFDEDTSIRNAVATGSGRVNLTPVLRSRP
jgi:hypothetical protein